MRSWPLLVVVLLLAPSLVEAAHVHDHRYMVIGRVLDESGLPAANVPVRGELQGAPSFVPAQVGRTNCFGDFVLVFSVGDLTGASLRVTVNDRSSEQTLDLEMRRTIAKLTLAGTFAPADCAGPRANFTQRHVVTGRLLDAEGQPRVGEDVTVRLELADGGTLTTDGTTNEAGDYAIGFRSARFAAGGQAVISDGEAVWTSPMDTEYGMTVADHREEGRSGTLGLVAGLFALAAAGVLAYLWFQRRET